MIQMKNIVREGHPSLRTIADEVSLPPSNEDVQILNDMLTFLKNSQDEEISEKYGLRAGVGLAAPQLGINKRLIVIHFIGHNDKINSYQLINPKIISHSAEKAYLASGEGCLSVDRAVEGYVMRYARVTVQAMDIDGNPFKIRLRDYPAIVFQHEIDHLNGTMFFDHINQENPFYVPEDAKVVE